MEISVKEISFLEKNKAKVNVLVRYKDLDDIDVGEIFDETFKESGITSKETEHFEKINKVKIDKFYNYFENKIKEEIYENFKPILKESEENKPFINLQWIFNWVYRDRIK